jgi:hypothetical protein
MSVRPTTFAVAALAALAVAVAPAFATEPAPPNPPPPPTTPGQPTTPTPTPPPPTTPNPPPPTSGPAPAPKKCVDTMRPSSKLAGSAVRRGHVTTLRGKTRDLGCKVSGLGTVRSVQISISRAVGKQCQFVNMSGKSGPKRKCSAPGWLRAKGGANWKLQLRKPLAAGKYIVRVRATDASRNVERPRSFRLTVR